MAIPITTTRARLVQMYKKWNADYLADPTDFCDIESTDEFAERQADELIKRLKQKEK